MVGQDFKYVNRDWREESPRTSQFCFEDLIYFCCVYVLLLKHSVFVMFHHYI